MQNVMIGATAGARTILNVFTLSSHEKKTSANTRSEEFHVTFGCVEEIRRYQLISWHILVNTTTKLQMAPSSDPRALSRHPLSHPRTAFTLPSPLLSGALLRPPSRTAALRHVPHACAVSPDEALFTAAPNSHCQFSSRRRSPPFFEGWYVRFTLPNDAGSLAFIFALEAPDRGTLQLIDVSGRLLVSRLPLDADFHGDCVAGSPWSLSHWAPVDTGRSTHAERTRMEGWTASAFGTHGSVTARDHASGTPVTARWAIDYTPCLSWGSQGQVPKHTGTWLAQFPIFEPAYQVLMAHGCVTQGSVHLNEDVSTNVAGAAVYIEKNWGAQFPPRWFWMQCNSFARLDLSVVAVGAVRRVIVADETVGMVAVHWKGQLFEFAPWTVRALRWAVRWGRWSVNAEARSGHSVVVEGSTKVGDEGLGVLGPTGEGGMKVTMRDSMNGEMRVVLKCPEGEVLVDATACNGQLEIGGEPWSEGAWKASVPPMGQPLRGLVNVFNGPTECLR